MLVILTHDNVLSVQQVCSGCLLSTRQGLPRWHRGNLSCGNSLNQLDHRQVHLYECEMGFKVAEIQEEASSI